MRIIPYASWSLALGVAALVACSPDTDGTNTTGAGSGGSAGGSSDGGATGSGGDTTGNATQVGPSGSGGSDPSSTSSSQGGSGPCAAGTIVCEGATKQVCDGNGGFTDVQECAPGVCVANIGCTVCAPNLGTCAGEVSTVCKSDGSGFVDYVCDPVQGVTCDPASGHCTGACAPEGLGTSYIGCDYYPTVSPQLVADNFHFAVAIANTTTEAANVRITRGAADVANDAIAPNSVKIINLPWIPELKTPFASTMLADGAYRLRTNRPVTVYQYSPIEYTDGFGASYSNDASLLLPSNAWTGNYRVASRNSWLFEQGGVSYPGFYSVVASQDGTSVTVTPSTTGGSIVAGGGLPATGAGTVILNEGDVLQVLSALSGFNPDPNDLTGTLVAADKPVQVIAGHQCTFIPYNVGYCDHLEEAMPPIETLSTEYIVTPPLIPTGGATPKAQMVRVIAIEANTTLTYDPPQSAPTTLATPGQFFEIPQTLADFVISADKPILVSQYMQGQDAGGGSGDPAMALAVATEQYRSAYLFHAPTNYESNYVNITAPSAATITLDGAVVSGFIPIGASGYGILRLPLNNGGDGNHTITGTAPFGISVYGYGQYTSFWYPGGLDLDKGETN